jgi:hypothetical protein
MEKAFFVYYSDGHYELGGVGLESFVSEKDVTDFIETRMREVARHGGMPSVDSYTVIRGRIMEVVPFERIKSVKLR